jgi:hypothetical protein
VRTSCPVLCVGMVLVFIRCVLIWGGVHIEALERAAARAAGHWCAFFIFCESDF